MVNDPKKRILNVNSGVTEIHLNDEDKRFIEEANKNQADYIVGCLALIINHAHGMTNDTGGVPYHFNISKGAHS